MLKSVKITTYIAETYEGGMNQFLNDGGALCYLPEPTDLMYVVHPDLSEEIKKGLTNMFAETLIFGDRWNFEGATDEDYDRIKNTLVDILKGIGFENVGITVNPAVVGISLPDVNKNDRKMDKLVDAFMTLPGLARGVLILKNGYVAFDGKNAFKAQENEPTHKKGPKVTAILTGRPKRDKVISSDDILNVRIALETATTIDELIAQL